MIVIMNNGSLILKWFFLIMVSGDSEEGAKSDEKERYLRKEEKALAKVSLAVDNCSKCKIAQ